MPEGAQPLLGGGDQIPAAASACTRIGAGTACISLRRAARSSGEADSGPAAALRVGGYAREGQGFRIAAGRTVGDFELRRGLTYGHAPTRLKKEQGCHQVTCLHFSLAISNRP